MLGRSKAELLATLTYREYVDWWLYYQAEPWGEARADERLMAMVMWLKSQVEFNADNLPEFHYPYFKQHDTQEAVNEAKALMERLRRGDNAGETRDCDAGRHEGPARGVQPGEGGSAGV